MGVVASWRDEMRSAYLYGVLAEVEPDQARRALFARLAGAAGAQADAWRARAAAERVALPASFAPDLRARAVARLLRLLGPRRLRTVLAAMKVRGLSTYAARPPDGHAMPSSVDDVGRRHRTAAGGTLRAAVFGVNDGLVSNTSLILGVASATADAQVIVLSGVAGLLAGASSMAAGEYVSVRSQRELLEHQLDAERAELEAYPAQEAAELSLIYQARGLDQAAADELARRLIAHPEHALDTLAREELGVDPGELGSPWRAAGSSLVAFAAGASLPLAPFLVGLGAAALPVAIVVAALALFGVGAALSLFTGRSPWAGGLRMLLIGAAAGALTSAIGRLVGVSVS
jgi:VIT1/CCC1 family predicted Fe2+/Mn2+ transporter